MQVDDVKPQHDLDAQRSQGRAWVTLAGRKALELAQAEAVVARLKGQIEEADRRASKALAANHFEVGKSCTDLRPYLDNALSSLFRLEELLGR